MLAARSTATGIAGGMPMSAEMTMTETATAGVSRSTWAEVADVIELAGQLQLIELASQNGIHTKGTPYEWEHGYIPLTPVAAASHGHGKVPKGWHAPGGRSKDAAKAEPVKAPPDRFTGPDGTMAMGNWHAGHQAIAQAPLDVLPKDRSRQVPVPGSKYGRNVKGAWSDPVWVAKPGGGYAMSARWKSKEQKVSGDDGKYVTHPAMDERVLTPFTGDASGKKAQEEKTKAAAQVKQQAADAVKQQAATRAQAEQDARQQVADAARQVKAAAAARDRQVKANAKAQAEQDARNARYAAQDAKRKAEAAQEAAEREQAGREHAEMVARERKAGESNATAGARMNARAQAGMAHLAETTGLDPHVIISAKPQVGHTEAMQAHDHLMAGRYAQATEALGRAADHARASHSPVEAKRLDAARAKIVKATAHPKTALPALAKVAGSQKRDGSFTALDHEGTEHTIKLDKANGVLSVSTAKGTLTDATADAVFDNPTKAARQLAARIRDAVVPAPGSDEAKLQRQAGQAVINGRMLQPKEEAALRRRNDAQTLQASAKKAGTTVQTANTWDELTAVIDLAATATAPAQPRKAGIMAGVTAAGNAAARTTPPEGRSAGVRRQPAAVTPPKARPRLTPLTPMRHQTAKSLRKLADSVRDTHPEMITHQHLRDAARVLESGNEEGAQRHLRAAIGSVTPQALMRHGVHTDDGHIQGKQAMAGIHRHLLLVKDIMDAGEKNRAAIARQAVGDDTGSPPLPASPVHAADPNAGYGPGALSQRPAARQPGGDRALNAPNRTNSGGPDPAVADPAPPPKGPRQFARTWGELLSVIDLAWIASPSKGEWAAIDAKSGHSLPDAKDGDDEDKADAHIRAARQATQIGQHAVAIKHLARASALTSDPGKQAAVNTLRGAVAKNAQLRGQSQQLVNLSAETGRLAVTPAPRGKPGGPGLYDVKGMGHDPYTQQIVKALIEKRGMDPHQAYAVARGAIRKWMRGGGKVRPEVRAAAGVAEADELAKQARAKATR